MPRETCGDQIQDVYCLAAELQLSSASGCFPTGERTGGGCSTDPKDPTPTAIYIDPLLSKLSDIKIGCHIGDICANAFAYAADGPLLTLSCTGCFVVILKFSNQWVEHVKLKIFVSLNNFHRSIFKKLWAI